ncbi:hypothetical protein ACJ41O_007547 [Fusarium nematophilum]
MGLSRRPASAAWGSSRADKSELSPPAEENATAQSEKPSTRSFSGRFKHFFKPLKMSPLPQPTTITSRSSRAVSPLSVSPRTKATRPYTMGDFTFKSPLSSHPVSQTVSPYVPPDGGQLHELGHFDHQPVQSQLGENAHQPLPVAAPSYESHAEYLHATNVTGMQQQAVSVESQPPKYLVTRSGEPQSSGNSLLSLDPEGSIKKSKQWLDRVRGYTIRSLDRFSMPVLGTPSSGGSDLAGVGSQWDTANKAASQMGRDEVDIPAQTAGLQSVPASIAGGHEQDMTSVPRSLWPASFKRASVAPKYPEIPSESVAGSDVSTRRFSSDTTQIFTRPSSIVSAATSWDSTGRMSAQHSRVSTMMSKRNASSSSIHNSHRASPAPRPEINLDEHPVPPIPSAPGFSPVPAVPTVPAVPAVVSPVAPDVSWPPRSLENHAIKDWINCLDHSVSDQINAAGLAAQQRRSHKNKQTELLQGQQPVGDMETKRDHLRPNPNTAPADENADAASKAALSVIEEGYSDAGCSHNETNSPTQNQPTSECNENSLLHPRRCFSNQDMRSCTSTDSMTEPTSAKSRQPAQTPATSVVEQDHDDEEAEESEDDEAMSDHSYETDESFNEAFFATSLDSSLLDAAVTLKDHIACKVLATVLEWVRSCSPGEQAGEGSSNSVPGASFATRGGSGLTARDGSGKKRSLDGRGPGRDDDDDQGKRRKMDATPVDEETAGLGLKLACPFTKTYPNQKWPKCRRGFPEVHRIKAHIYKHHVSIRCDRCFEEFKESEELTEHRRKDEQCKVIDRPDNLLTIDEQTRSKIQSRSGARNASQEEKWKHIYKIIFPNVSDEDIPSPYYENPDVKISMSPQAQTEYRTFLQQEIPPHVIRNVTKSLNRMPDVRQALAVSERKLSEMLHRAVWDALDVALPKIFPQAEQPGLQTTPTTDGMSEISKRMQDQHLPSTSSTPESARAEGIHMSGNLARVGRVVPGNFVQLYHYPREISEISSMPTDNSALASQAHSTPGTSQMPSQQDAPSFGGMPAPAVDQPYGDVPSSTQVGNIDDMADMNFNFAQPFGDVPLPAQFGNFDDMIDFNFD